MVNKENRQVKSHTNKSQAHHQQRIVFGNHKFGKSQDQPGKIECIGHA